MSQPQDEVMRSIAGSLAGIAQTLQGIEMELAGIRRQMPDSPERQEENLQFMRWVEKHGIDSLLSPPQPPAPPWAGGGSTP